ncbi:Hypothetical protein CGLY_00525 [Corynebacterium glyciniphilum AJ 3170]|uniref:Uncharacterized protein n=1 Tax=Corynebacterium glyciniphilum AJ 3170 TaxID=1404245 RepID=X5DHN2_9CORY|nr:Hypothetical protein CGLY_00525 [Corynebacterium glyciniphilum AJ 3170]
MKDNFEAIVDLGARSSLGSTYLAGLEEIDTPDLYTVTVRFVEPNAQFLEASSAMTLVFYAPETLGKSPEGRCTGDLGGPGPSHWPTSVNPVRVVYPSATDSAVDRPPTEQDRYAARAS